MWFFLYCVSYPLFVYSNRKYQIWVGALHIWLMRTIIWLVYPLKTVMLLPTHHTELSSIMSYCFPNDHFRNSSLYVRLFVLTILSNLLICPLNFLPILNCIPTFCSFVFVIEHGCLCDWIDGQMDNQLIIDLRSISFVFVGEHGCVCDWIDRHIDNQLIINLKSMGF